MRGIIFNQVRFVANWVILHSSFSTRQLLSAPVLSKTFSLLGNFAAFIAAFVLACAGIGAVLPERKVPVLTSKFDWLAQHGDEYDVLFVGSSRTYHQLAPEIFDAEMAAAGHRVRSFNVGADAMFPPEDTYVLEKILACRTKPVRLVLVECNPVNLRHGIDERYTLRAVHWHDSVRTWTTFRAAFFTDNKKRTWRKRLEKAQQRWPELSEHAGYWMERNSNIGRGHELLTEWLGTASSKNKTESGLGRRNDGLMPFSVSEVMNAEQGAVYEKELAGMRARSWRGSDGDPVSLEELRVKQRLVERSGGRMVMVIPPFVGDKIFRPSQAAGLPPLLDFTNPEKYPELFKAEHRLEISHMNNAGAQIYTRMVVRELLPLLNAEKR